MSPSRSAQDIQEFLSHEKAPFKFSLVFDIGNAYDPAFWEILFFLASNTFTQRHNELNLIVMAIPSDDVPLATHITDIKSRFDGELLAKFPGLLYTLKGLHEISTSGYIHQMPRLVEELSAIKSSTGTRNK